MTIPTHGLRQKQFLDEVAESLTPDEIRRLGDSLLRVADAVDQDWRLTSGKATFRGPNEMSEIQSSASALAEKAQLEYARRRKRSKFVPNHILGEPAWNMLLELFMQYAQKAKVSVTSLCIASDCPQTTALRHICMLEDEGYVRRVADESDRRVTFVELTDAGILAMGKYLDET